MSLAGLAEFLAEHLPSRSDAKKDFAMRYTLTIDDRQNLLDLAVHGQILEASRYALGLIAKYLEFKGVLDIGIRIATHEDMIRERGEYADGLLPSIISLSLRDNIFTNNTVVEAISGFDAAPGDFDAGLTIFLGKDGAIRNYGLPVWFDPSPQYGVNPNIPLGHFDYISVFVHEVFHGLGFVRYSSEFSSLVTLLDDGNYYFSGEKVKSLYGGPLPLAPDDHSGYADHYGNTALHEHKINSGLMFQWGNYLDNRLDIGQIDLAILEDLGLSIKTYDGLALFDPLISGTPPEFSKNWVEGGPQDSIFNNSDLAEYIDAGEGFDEILYRDSHMRYNVSLENGLIKIMDKVTQNQDWFMNVERIHFSGRSLAMDVYAGPGEVYRLYKASFDRAPDPEGLGYWIYQRDAGVELSAIALRFIESEEFSRNYGVDQKDDAFLSTLYQNVLEREADAAGLAYWLSELQGGQQSRADILVGFSESSENRINLQGVIDQVIEYVRFDMA